MSGGKWDYIQNRIDNKDVVSDMEYEAYKAIKEGREDVARIIMQSAFLVKAATIAIQRCDWLFSGDDGFDSFIERYEEEMNCLKLGGSVNDQ